MGNQRITDLTKVNNFSGDGDLIPIIINTGTVPVNAAITKANFAAAISSGSFVTLDTPQTITGEKTFNADINLTGERYINVSELEIRHTNGYNYIVIADDIVDISANKFSIGSTTSANGVYTDGAAGDPLVIDARENNLVFDLGTNGNRVTPNIGDVLVCVDTSGKVEWQSSGSGSFVTLDTAQTITETKTFDTGNTDTKIVVDNLTETSKGIVINNDGGTDSTFETVGIDINTTGWGYGIRVVNDDIGFAVYGEDNGNSAGVVGRTNGIGAGLLGRTESTGEALRLTGQGSGDRIKAQNTTGNIVYTLDKDGNVDANSFVGDGSGLTNLNALELDNTTPFTPDADYEPATKKYVDDNAGGAITKEWTFGRWVDFNVDGRWVGHYNSKDGAQLLNWNRGTGTDPSIPNYYGFVLLEPNSVLKKLVLSALYDSVYTGIDIQIWGAEANTTTVTKLYSGTFSPVSPDTSLQSYDRYELDMGDISLTNSHRLFVAVRQQQATLATKTIKGQIKLIWEES